MPRIHSHYENLKVPRDASPEAIRAAWRRLAQRHHPDRRPGDAEAVRVMQLINSAYDTLSDPARRAEHAGLEPPGVSRVLQALCGGVAPMMRRNAGLNIEHRTSNTELRTSN